MQIFQEAHRFTQPTSNLFLHASRSERIPLLRPRNFGKVEILRIVTVGAVVAAPARVTHNFIRPSIQLFVSANTQFEDEEDSD